MKHYTLENKPNFQQNDVVEVDFGVISPQGEILKGRIVGKASEHIIDFWIVDFGKLLEPFSYLFQQ